MLIKIYRHALLNEIVFIFKITETIFKLHFDFRLTCWELFACVLRIKLVYFSYLINGSQGITYPLVNVSLS